MKYIASVSFGKDSLAMLLLLIKKGEPLDEVVFYDTGKEFQAIYDMRDKVLPLLKEQGIKYTELQPEMSFDYKMFEKPVKKRGTNIVYKQGYGWCGGTCRWGTTDKLKALERYGKGSVEYIGIAVDEPIRLEKERKGNKRFPLAEWNITELEALQICYDNGFYWEENNIRLYDILDRVSCWCCRNKNLKELQGIYLNFPDYWRQLVVMEEKIGANMKKSGSLLQLADRYNDTGKFSKK